MGLFSRLTRKSRAKEALKIQYPETCGVAPEVLERMCIALDASHGEDEEPAPSFITADLRTVPPRPTTQGYWQSQSIEQESEVSFPAELDKPIDEDEVVAPQRTASVRTTNSFSSPAPEQTAAHVEKPKETLSHQGGKNLRDGELDTAIDQARWNVSRKTVVIDALEVDRDDLVEQLKEAQERLCRLEEEEE